MIANDALDNRLDWRSLDFAATALDDAIEIDPAYDSAYSQMGVVLALRREFDAAEWYLERALTLRPKFMAAYLNLGELLTVQRKFDEATDVYRRCTEANPLFVRCYRYWADLLAVEKGDRSAAIELYEKAIAADPKYLAVRVALANLEMQRGNTDRAVTQYKSIQELEPGKYAFLLHGILVDPEPQAPAR